MKQIKIKKIEKNVIVNFLKSFNFLFNFFLLIKAIIIFYLNKFV